MMYTHSSFPEHLPVTPLPKLSFDKLIDNDPRECSSLLEAPKHFGCFQLDFSDSQSDTLFLPHVEQVFDLGKSFCAQDMEQKEKFPLDKSNFGYKPHGALKFYDGRPDLTESFSFSKDTLMKGTTGDTPSMYADPHIRAMLSTWTKSAHRVAMLVIQRLSEQLEV